MIRSSPLILAAAVLFSSSIVCAQNHSDADKELLRIVKDGKYGYIDHRGKIVIEPQFMWGGDFRLGYAPVYVCGRTVWVDTAGKVHAQARYDKNLLRPIKVGDKYGYKDGSGKIRIQPGFDDAWLFTEGLAPIRIGDLWGYIDRTGKQVAPPTFTIAGYFQDGVASVYKNEDYGLINKQGKVLASGYQSPGSLPSERRFPVQRDDKCGYLDLHGNIAIPLTFKSCGSFSGGVAAVRLEHKYGYIDRKGRIEIPFIFDDAGLFARRLAPVKIGKETGFIDRSGKFAFRLPFNAAASFHFGGTDGPNSGDVDVTPFWTEGNGFGYVNTAGLVVWGPTSETPDHAPIFGWTEEDKASSCQGLALEVRESLGNLPHD